MKNKVIVIVGPTGVGKTSLSIELAKMLDGEIISGDSLQVYRHLDIGTAKATIEERENIPHYLLDVREPIEKYTAFDFKEEAAMRISDIINRGKVPIIVGGTGMYIQSLLFDFQLGKNESESLQQEKRASLEKLAFEKGNEWLWDHLNQIDSKAAATIHHNNVKRVIRAIEVFENTGKSILDQQKIDFKNSDDMKYDAYIIGLTTERDLLYQRINQRVDMMMSQGLLEEAKYVHQLGSVQASQGIGYKEFFPYFDEQSSLDEAVDKVKQHSRQYAKRQMTWFRNRMNVNWWDLVTNPDSVSRLKEELEPWIKE
ncbi:tRNA (adenosine(37)-N6)-dimethylallyltransferase MiaA [Vagococcus silagei]|uniref:tRNA dimethylallyltransferase n=1 Tax=Vagococcus silagei TaxID=2508885 RepID=A0A4S3B3A6_9ENTE|nr:tRNA (adenosine(37)-N6)-dimethylallyltransferase MiaA [Vagococcus silagei]THB61624.1 tRNA (adenosine(37)-N6)-dimethylallyltransferase MiaA [Vagococcus silagei]